MKSDIFLPLRITLTLNWPWVYQKTKTWSVKYLIEVADKDTMTTLEITNFLKYLYKTVLKTKCGWLPCVNIWLKVDCT